MKHVAIIAAALAAFTAGPAAADTILHLTRLPGRCLPDPQGAHEIGGQKCQYYHGFRSDISYRASEGDQVVARLAKGLSNGGYDLVDIPHFLRRVETASGPVLMGIPEPGTYTVAVYQGGVRHPSLDIVLRFIPR